MMAADAPGQGEAALARAWTLHVPDGVGPLCLGPLRPGQSRAEVAAFDGLYGAVERVEDDASRTASMAAGFEDLEQFGFSPDEVAAARDAWDAVAQANRDLVTEDRGLAGPSIDYVDGRLTRVATDHHCARLTLAGRPVFAGDGTATLAALQRLEAGEALRAGDTVWFPRLCVTAIGFYGEREDGTVGPLDDPADPRIRHLVLEPFAPPPDAPAPVPVAFIAG